MYCIPGREVTLKGYNLRTGYKYGEKIPFVLNGKINKEQEDNDNIAYYDNISYLYGYYEE
jgi:hypothetical protein